MALGDGHLVERLLNTGWLYTGRYSRCYYVAVYRTIMRVNTIYLVRIRFTHFAMFGPQKGGGGQRSSNDIGKQW